MSDETELEDAFRDGLQRAAGHAEVGVPLAARAHAGARTRRRRRWATVSTVAAVVAVAGVTAVVRSGGDTGTSPSDHTATQPPTQATAAPVTDWRPESWHGLTVEVPADWGWGTAPLTVGNDDLQAYMCGDVNPSKPYVGRPIMLSDACGNVEDPSPAAPYVWLGADVAPGTAELGGGYTQETVEAFGTTLTVASTDPALRQHVIDSARATTDCEAALPSRPEIEGMPTEGLDPIRSAQLCAYSPGNDGLDLVYAATLDQATAQSLYDGDWLGTKTGQDFCDSKFHEYVRVRFTGKDRMGSSDLTADWVVEPGCQQVEVGPGLVVPLKPAGLAALSDNGLPKVLRSFIGMLG